MALVVAFVFGPATFVGGNLATLHSVSPLTRAFEDSLVASWNSTGDGLIPEMSALVDLWRRWHALKVVIAALLTTVLARLAVVLWKRFLDPSTVRQRDSVGYAVCAVAATVLALCAVTLVAVNIQSTAAPLSALLPLLPADPPPGELREVMRHIGVALSGVEGSDNHRPVVMIIADSQRVYLNTLAVTTSILASAFTAGTLRARKVFRAASPAHRRRRRTALCLGIGSAILAASTFGAAAATAVSAMEPQATLADIFTTR